MTHYYCKYCGQKFPTISSLTSGKCIKHPDGAYEGRHALYEGSENVLVPFCKGGQYVSRPKISKNFQDIK